METDLMLIEKRQELKNEITAGIDKTPMARVFNVTSSVVQNITRSQKPLPVLYCTALLAPLILIPILFYMILFHQSRLTPEISLFSGIVILEVGLLNVVGTYFNINRTLLSIRDTLVDSIESFTNLSDLQQWFDLGWSSGKFNSFLFGWNAILVGGTTFLFYVWEEVHFESALFIFFLVYSILLGIAWYYVPLMLLLPMRLRFYQYTIYDNDPARSEVIEHILALTNRYTNGYLLMVILAQLSLANANLPIIFEVGVLFVFGWIPVITQYVVNQISIRNIVSSSKRKTLNRIQTQIKEFHDGDIINKDNIETINRLMDYHERIRKTPDSSLDLESVLRFLNQLVLPLIAFLLGNLDKVIAFLR